MRKKYLSFQSDKCPITALFQVLSPFSTWRICPRKKKKKKQFLIMLSNSCFRFTSREQIRQVKNKTGFAGIPCVKAEKNTTSIISKKYHAETYCNQFLFLFQRGTQLFHQFRFLTIFNLEMIKCFVTCNGTV